MPTGTRLITTPLRRSTSSCAESEIEIDQLTGRRLSSFRGTQPRTPLGSAVEMTATQLPRVRAIPTVCSEPYSVRALTVASAAPPGRRRRTSESARGVAAKNGSTGRTVGLATALAVATSATASTARKGRMRPRSAAIPRCGSLLRGTGSAEGASSCLRCLAVLELLWHPDAVAFAFSREGPATGDDELDVLGDTYRGRFLGADELARFEPDEPLADSARAVLHVRELARRAVSEGLVFPQAAEIGGEWFAFWGATLEAEIEQTLTRIAAASPPVIADYFHGDRVATVNDLYPRLVDRIARDRLVDAGVRLGSARPFGRNRAVEAFLHGLTSP